MSNDGGINMTILSSLSIICAIIVLAVMIVKLKGQVIKELKEENTKMRYALERLKYAIKEDCSTNCGAAGQDCDGCTTDSRLNFIDSALARSDYHG
jgi:hypothetical protein